MKKTTLIFFLIIILIGCSKKVHTVSLYDENKNIIKDVFFDFNGNLIREENMNNELMRLNKFTYDSLNRIEKEENYYCIKNGDSCQLLQYRVYKYIGDHNSMETLYESDTSIRVIKENTVLKNLKISKIYSWELMATKNPKKENSIKLLDSTFINNENRTIESRQYNLSIQSKEPIIEKITYNKNGKDYEIKFMGKDTIIKLKYSKLQKWANKKKLKYDRFNNEYQSYKVQYY